MYVCGHIYIYISVCMYVEKEELSIEFQPYYGRRPGLILTHSPKAVVSIEDNVSTPTGAYGDVFRSSTDKQMLGQESSRVG